MTGMRNENTVYYLDRPGAWGQFGLGTLLLLVPLSLTIAFSIPGVFFEVFPNAPKRRNPLGMAIVGAGAFGMMGAGVYFLSTAIRTLRDRAPKLEFTAAGVIDYRGQNTVEWARILSARVAVEKMGDRIKRAVMTLVVLGDSGVRGVDIDVKGLSQSPESIFARMQMDHAKAGLIRDSVSGAIQMPAEPAAVFGVQPPPVSDPTSDHPG